MQAAWQVVHSSLVHPNFMFVGHILPGSDSKRQLLVNVPAETTLYARHRQVLSIARHFSEAL